MPFSHSGGKSPLHLLMEYLAVKDQQAAERQEAAWAAEEDERWVWSGDTAAAQEDREEVAVEEDG